MKKLSSYDNLPTLLSTRSAYRSLQQAIVAAVVVFAGQANAAWNDGGVNVISFTTSNPERILYRDNVSGTESSRSMWATDYGNYVNTRAATDLRNVASFKPGTYYYPERVAITPMASGAFVYSNSSSSTIGAACGLAGQTCAAAVNLSVGTSGCVTHEVKIGLSGTFAPLKWVPSLAAVAEGSYTKGWSHCQTATQGHSCAGIRISGMSTLNYATTEARSRIGWTKMTETAAVVEMEFRGDNLPSDFKTKCGLAEGQYSRVRRLFGPDYHTCVTTASSKLNWEQYGNWPASLNSIDLNCRVIRDN
jgi:hypothetical protein